MSSGVRMSSGVFCRASCFFLNFFSTTCFLILLLPAMLVCSHILFFPSIPNLQDTLKAAFQTYAPVKDRDTTGVYRDAVGCCEMLWDAWKLESFKKTHTHTHTLRKEREKLETHPSGWWFFNWMWHIGFECGIACGIACRISVTFLDVASHLCSFIQWRHMCFLSWELPWVHLGFISGSCSEFGQWIYTFTRLLGITGWANVVYILGDDVANF